MLNCFRPSLFVATLIAVLNLTCGADARATGTVHDFELKVSLGERRFSCRGVITIQPLSRDLPRLNARITVDCNAGGGAVLRLELSEGEIFDFLHFEEPADVALSYYDESGVQQWAESSVRIVLTGTEAALEGRSDAGEFRTSGPIWFQCTDAYRTQMNERVGGTFCDEAIAQLAVTEPPFRIVPAEIDHDSGGCAAGDPARTPLGGLAICMAVCLTLLCCRRRSVS